jgi:hypothetical protein
MVYNKAGRELGYLQRRWFIAGLSPAWKHAIAPVRLKRPGIPHSAIIA